ncbi:putative uncharacterized protein [Clostridium sp. CAG:242]|nr:putative uncharacterized protein [Clostridium sp. CAG:242]
MGKKIYIAIDLKSFYASVECRERNFDPMTTNLVVADASRTEKTICLAVSPSLKAYGIPGRARLFEVIQKVQEANEKRKAKSPNQQFTGSSCDDKELKSHPELAIDYHIAPPQMAHYIKISAQIYKIYLKYIAAEDIHVYSIDEVFMDVTNYLAMYQLSARELAMKIILDVLETTGITATAGIGPNLYLCKVALDIGAKHIKPDKNGVRIAELDEMSYRQSLWTHQPITDFWRVGRGYAKRLAEYGMYTMGDVARCSIGKDTDYRNEELLYKLFGINAELLIDHAWGWEPCTIADIKAYRPENNSICSGQVLPCPYDYEKTRLVVREMADSMALGLVDKACVTNQLVLTIGYDSENLKKGYRGDVTIDRYGRPIPKHAHGTINLDAFSSSARKIVDAALTLYDRIMDSELTVRRLSLTANHVISETDIPSKQICEQLDLFTDYAAIEKQQQEEKEQLEQEKKIQKTMLSIQKKFGKNAILKGTNLKDGATAKDRNQKIGGHRA